MIHDDICYGFSMVASGAVCNSAHFYDDSDFSLVRRRPTAIGYSITGRNDVATISFSA